jgi:hypothetical protein
MSPKVNGLARTYQSNNAAIAERNPHMRLSAARRELGLILHCPPSNPEFWSVCFGMEVTLCAPSTADGRAGLVWARRAI